MKTGLAFFHGWGLDKRFWQPLAGAFSGHPATFFDAGYYGTPCLADYSTAERWIGIGHSLGFARALTAPPPGGWAGMVSLGGFTRFCEHVPGQGGQPRRVVERMQRVFAREPRAVLRDFLDRCGLLALMPDAEAALDETRLADDLAVLADIDESAALAVLQAPLLALAAADDGIVPPMLSEALFAGRPTTRLVWRERGGHALGYAGAEECARVIAEFVETIK